MTKEEIEKIMRLVNAGRPQVNQTFNFNAPIGQQIAHVDKIEAHFDKNMGMQIAVVEDAPSTHSTTRSASKGLSAGGLLQIRCHPSASRP